MLQVSNSAQHSAVTRQSIIPGPWWRPVTASSACATNNKTLQSQPKSYLRRKETCWQCKCI